MSSIRTIEMFVSKENLNALGQLEYFLESVARVVRPGEELVSVEMDLPDVIPIKMKVRREEVEVTRYNGQG